MSTKNGEHNVEFTKNYKHLHYLLKDAGEASVQNVNIRAAGSVHAEVCHQHKVWGQRGAETYNDSDQLCAHYSKAVSQKEGLAWYLAIW